MKKLLIVALMAAALGVHAESTPAKKELIAKVLKFQQPGIERAASLLAERPAMQLQQQAGMVLQTRIAPEKREAMGKEIQADLKKYVEEVVPLVRERAVKLAPSTIGVLLDEKFTEDELTQLIAIFESPVNRKFAQLGGEMDKSLGEKLMSDIQGTVTPKVKALEQSIAKRLGVPAGPVAAPAAKGAGAPAKAASK